MKLDNVPVYNSGHYTNCILLYFPLFTQILQIILHHFNMCVRKKVCSMYCIEGYSSYIGFYVYSVSFPSCMDTKTTFFVVFPLSKRVVGYGAISHKYSHIAAYTRN